jgi:hypothetical protein
MAESGREWKEVSPGLEDVFIHLMGTSSEPITEIH